MQSTECPGTGRRFTGGTSVRQVICPVCHRTGRAIGAPKAKRKDVVPSHPQPDPHYPAGIALLA